MLASARSGSSAALRTLARWEPALFVLLIAIQLIPVWSVKYLPTTDGAAHVASADVMRLYHDPALPVFREYYFISYRPVPNLAGHLLLAGLLRFVSPVVAEKIVVSLIIVAFPLAMRYPAKSIRRGAAPIAWLAFPMTYSFLLAQGFYNFCLSLAALMLVIGYWVRHRERMNLGRGLVLFVLLAILYTCHLFALALAGGVLVLLSASNVWSARGTSRAGSPISSPKPVDSSVGVPINRPSAIRTGIITLAAIVPLALMAIVFKPVTTGYESLSEPWSPKDDLLSILKFSTMVSYRTSEAIIGSAIAGVILALALWAVYARSRRWALRRFDVLALMSLGLMGLYFKAHDGNSIHFYVPPRTLFCSYLFLVLWLAAQPITRRIRAMIVPISAVLALGMLASHALKYREFAPQLREFVSAGDHIRPNSTFLPLIFAPQGRNPAGQPSSVDVAPFFMASGYIAAQGRAVDLRNYEARTDHFPVRFRPGLDPYDHLAQARPGESVIVRLCSRPELISIGPAQPACLTFACSTIWIEKPDRITTGFDRIPPQIDLARFTKAGGQVDYILLWGMTPDEQQMPGTILLMHQLEAGYRKIDVPGAKWTQLWERK